MPCEGGVCKGFAYTEAVSCDHQCQLDGRGGSEDGFSSDNQTAPIAAHRVRADPSEDAREHSPVPSPAIDTQSNRQVRGGEHVGARGRERPGGADLEPCVTRLPVGCARWCQ